MEVRRTLLIEGCDALLRFRRIVEHLHGMQGKVADTANVVGVGVEGALRQCDRRRRPLRKLVGPILDSGIQLRRRNDLVDQAHFARLLGGVAVIDEPDLARLLVADVARKEGRAPTGIDGANLWADLTELSGVGCNRQIAKRCQDVSAADSKAVNARDDWLGNVADEALQLVDWQSDDTATVILTLMCGLIAAGAKSLVAHTCQH